MGDEDPEEGFLSAEELEDTDDDDNTNNTVNFVVRNPPPHDDANNPSSQSQSRQSTTNPRSSVSTERMAGQSARSSLSIDSRDPERTASQNNGERKGAEAGVDNKSGKNDDNVGDGSASSGSGGGGIKVIINGSSSCCSSSSSSSCGTSGGGVGSSKKYAGGSLSLSIDRESGSCNGCRTKSERSSGSDCTASTASKGHDRKEASSSSVLSSSFPKFHFFKDNKKPKGVGNSSSRNSSNAGNTTRKESEHSDSDVARPPRKSPGSSSRALEEEERKTGGEVQGSGSSSSSSSCSGSSGSSSSSSSRSLLKTNVFSKIGTTLSLAKFDDSQATHNKDPTEQELDQGELKATKDFLGMGRIFKQMTESAKSALFTTLGSKQPTSANQVRVQVQKKNMQCLSDLRLVQILAAHTGPIWSFRFNHDNTLLATAGQDSVVRVWAVLGSAAAKEHSKLWPISVAPETVSAAQGGQLVLHPVPLRMFSGHKADVIDLSWSKQDFLLSASIDKTARLWHASRERCLCVFQHPDFVTSVAFHPLADRFFVSGSFGKTLRIWNIPEHRVMNWVQTGNVITSAAFSPNGQVVVAGLYDGRVMLYHTEPALKHYTQIDCRNASGKFSKGKKVTGLQYSSDGKHLLVTTNDSRIRLYGMDDFSLVAKYKGLVNEDLQIKAFFSEDGTHVISGSQDAKVYIWETLSSYVPALNPALLGGKARRVYSYEVFTASDVTVTSAQFVPRSAIDMAMQAAKEAEASGVLVDEQACPDYLDSVIQHCILTVDDAGKLRIFFNLGKPVNV